MRKNLGILLVVFAIGALAGLPAAASQSVATASGAAVQSRVEINKAPAEELMKLPGIGESTARAIVDYRQENGPFGSVEDLIRVKGIGEKKLEAIRDLVVLN
jgi:competence protein ComEA